MFDRAAGGGRDNLVVVRAGPRSLHPRWGGPERNFDLLVCAYHEDAPLASNEDARVLIPGSKVAGLARLFAEHPHLLERYARIALIDDDILPDPGALSACFVIGKEEGLSIWQPALGAGSYFSYAALLRNDGFRLRYINFVEMMCPFFEAGALVRALALMGPSRETGIDTLWCRQFEDPHKRCAVIDAAAVLHTRPVGTLMSENGFPDEGSYDRHIARFLQDAGATFSGPVVYAGITANGVEVQTRFGVLLRSLRQLRAIPRSPMRHRLTARLILAHLRHQVTRPLNDSKAF